MKKLLRLLLIIFFPFGILYCVGKALFGGNLPQFLGCLFIFAIGVVLSIYFHSHDLIQPFIARLQAFF